MRLEGDGLPATIAKVRWRSGADYGLVFEQVFTLESIAVLAAQLQRPPRPLPAPATLLQAG